MDAGVSGNNTRWYITIAQLIEEMKPAIVEVQQGLHASTGNDLTTSFMNLITGSRSHILNSGRKT
jgi:hypothetical protein